MKNDMTYTRHVFYYETDRMGIVHHSNYVRWMEEARMDYMQKCGVDYTAIEADGVIMPVTGVTCDYKSSARFGDDVEIETKLIKFNGVRAEYSYKIRLSGGQTLLASGKSGHCFLDEVTRNPLNLKKRMPDISNIMSGLLPNAAE